MKPFLATALIFCLLLPFATAFVAGDNISIYDGGCTHVLLEVVANETIDVGELVASPNCLLNLSNSSVQIFNCSCSEVITLRPHVSARNFYWIRAEVWDLKELKEKIEVPVSRDGGKGGVCYVKWECSEWSACVNDTQKRVCTNKWDCTSDSESPKPLEVQSCVQEISSEEETISKVEEPESVVEEETKEVVVDAPPEPEEEVGWFKWWYVLIILLLFVLFLMAYDLYHAIRKDNKNQKVKKK